MLLKERLLEVSINQQALYTFTHVHRVEVNFQMYAAAELQQCQVQLTELSLSSQATDMKEEEQDLQAHATEQADTEVEDDPGIIIVYAPEETIHNALGQRGSPVPQGANAGASSTAFQDYVYQEILAFTNISARRNCIQKSPGVYFANLFHRLPQEAYVDLMQVLEDRFVLGTGPIVQWSLAVSAPPNPPLGAVLRVGGGGLGVGLVHFYRENIQQGVFRST